MTGLVMTEMALKPTNVQQMPVSVMARLESAVQQQPLEAVVQQTTAHSPCQSMTLQHGTVTHLKFRPPTMIVVGISPGMAWENK